MVHVVEYDIQWPCLFADEKARILSAFDNLSALVEHIGSTAVSGLAAKPVIDILIGTRFEELTKGHLDALRGFGYGYIRARRKGLCLYRGHPRSHFVHIVEIECPEWYDLLVFRDFLRTHSEEANKYDDLNYQEGPCSPQIISKASVHWFLIYSRKRDAGITANRNRGRIFSLITRASCKSRSVTETRFCNRSFSSRYI